MKTQIYSEEQLNRFLKLYSFYNKTYLEIANDLQIDKKIVSEMFIDSKDERVIINKAKQLFNNKRTKSKFKFPKDNAEIFYDWYKLQSRKCFYCEAEESKLKELFETKFLTSERRRGKSLELERRDSKTNVYSEDNCALICYFCNNHKSDIISEEDHKKYFAGAIKKYIDDKYEELQRSKK